MKKPLRLLSIFLCSLLAVVFALSHHVVTSAPPTVQAAGPSPACTFPTQAAATPEQTAWQLFVAANCPANAKQVVWETWIEQSDLYPANGAADHALGRPEHRLHGSPLARAMEAHEKGPGVELVPNTQCNKMNGPPPNVKPGAIICEEARLSPESQQFVLSKGYQVRAGQTKAAQKGVDIQFPNGGIEVKVDWVPGTDFNPPFTCSNPPKGVRVESIGGVCYAMAGMHISSKLLKNWLWATFEPQNMQTNPLRCITFGSCKDPWGSNPAVSNGGASGFTRQTLTMARLMKEARLAPEFLNYRLDGTQTEFTNANNRPTYLGNSVIEGENVGMKKNTASCITCHSYSSIKNDGTDGIVNLPKVPIGPQYQIPSGWIARDFAWSMAFSCPGSPFQKCTGAADEKMK